MKLLSLLLLSPLLAFANTTSDWRIQSVQWNPQDEIEFSEFVRNIGESKCSSTMGCLQIKENPFRQTDSAAWSVRTDCAKFPYVLRAYFAWKKGLPFSHVSAVAPVGLSKDIRYSAKGNIPISRRDAVGTLKLKVNAEKFITSMLWQVNTSTFRTSAENAPETQIISDFYSPELTREALVPGTMIYDPAGHVAVIYKIEDDGRILTLDAHTDDSITRGVFGTRFPRSIPAHGAGFKRWRPLVLVGAVNDVDRGLIGGTIFPLENGKISGFSLEQYSNVSVFQMAGQALDYFTFVRARLASSQFILDPVLETRAMLRGLCQDLKDRSRSVEVAVKSGIHLKPFPERLPANIFGADGEWEEYSTPSRDARLRQTFKDLRDQVALFLKTTSNPSLKEELRLVYELENQACIFGYEKTDGSVQHLNISGMLDRIFEVDFSPYQCSERRWGATTPQELAACPLDLGKKTWYEALQPLRNSLERNPSAFHGYTVDEILSGKAQIGAKQRPDVDVRSLLYSNVVVSGSP